MKSNLSYLFLCSLCFVLISATKLNAQCCRVPDSLKVRNITDSSFCLIWNVNDSLGCDTAHSFDVQYKDTAAANWNTITVIYTGGSTVKFCDTGAACRKYKWRVRKTCIHNGDTTTTVWVSGKSFTMDCDTTSLVYKSNTHWQEESKYTLSPNPARNMIFLAGNHTGKITISISNMQGKVVYQTNVTAVDKVSTSINVTQLTRGYYFVNISDGNRVTKLNFLKE